MSRSIDRVTTFHLGNRDEISHMNGLQNSSRLPSHPGYRDHMKRPLREKNKTDKTVKTALLSCPSSLKCVRQVYFFSLRLFKRSNITCQLVYKEI